MEKFKLSENFIEKYKNKKVLFGFNGLGEIVYMRTYARMKENGKREKWFETVRRVVEGTYNMQKKWIEDHRLGWNSWQAQKSAQEMYDRIFNMKFLPPGRGLWAMGSPIIEEKNLYAALNNCAFVSTADMKEDPVKPFLFMMDMSMLGVGVGFDIKGAGSVLIKGVNKKRIKEVFLIPDSREGWVESLKILLESYFNNLGEVEFDYSQIRKEGEIIKGFGGLASGYKPLYYLHESIRKILNEKTGELISGRIIADIMNLIGKCVVSGNVRRTAQIIFGDYNSDEYLDLKNYKKYPERKEYGWTSNNSIFCNIGMDYTEAVNRTIMNGEPGYFWLSNAQQYSRMNDGADNKDHRAMGANPCCVGENNWCITDRGIFQVKDLIGKKFKILSDGQFYDVVSDGFFLTGKKPLYKIETKKGFEFEVTLDHVVLTPDGEKKLEDLSIGSKIYLCDNSNNDFSIEENDEFFRGYLVGSFIGDGSFSGNDARLMFFGKTKFFMLKVIKNILKKLNLKCRKDFKGCLSRTRDLLIISLKSIFNLFLEYKIYSTKDKYINDYIESQSLDFQRGLVRGLFDTDGCVIYQKKIKNACVKLTQINLNNIKRVQRILARFGIISSIYVSQKECYKKFKTKDNEEKIYFCQPCYSLNISKDNLIRFKKYIGFYEPDKLKKLNKIIKRYKKGPFKEKFIDTILNVTYIGEQNVYDISMKEKHWFDLNGIKVHNCEQTLESYELCCLVETFPNNHENLEDFLRTLKFAYLYAKTVTLGETHWPETNRVMLRNRRIGCSMSGIVQFLEKNGIEELRKYCVEGYKAIQEYDKKYSDWLAIPRSIKTTSIKPSGTVSLLVGATPGCHFPKSRYYIRRVLLAKNSSLIPILEKAGYELEESKVDKSSMVVSIPIFIGKNIRTEKEVSIWEKVSLAAFLQKYWADNQVSCTVEFDPEKEGKDIKYILNYFQYQLKGISFLPRINESYEQMPYEEITEEKFKEMNSKIKKIDFTKYSDEFGEIDKFCDGDSCII